MENNANEENPFQDLLSAALTESGLTDDFDLDGLGQEEAAVQNIVNVPGNVSYLPEVHQIQGQYVQSELPSMAPTHSAGTPVRLVRPVGSTVVTCPATPTHPTGRGQPIVLTSAQASQLVSGTNSATSNVLQAVSTPTGTGAKAKKSIIHIVTPKNISGGSGQGAAATVKRVIKLQSATGGQRPGSPIVGQSSSGGIKVIQLGTKAPPSSPHNTVTLSGGDGKTYKIVTIKSASNTSQGQDAGASGSVSKPVLVTASSNQANVVRTLLATPGSTSRTLVNSQPGSSVRLSSPGTGTPTRAPTVQVRPTAGGPPITGSGIRTVVSNPVVKTLTAKPGQGSSPMIRVVPGQAVRAGPSQSSSSPIIIRAPSSSSSGPDGKPVTKVLKIIKPSVQQHQVTSVSEDRSVVSVPASSHTGAGRVVVTASSGSQPITRVIQLSAPTVSSQKSTSLTKGNVITIPRVTTTSVTGSQRNVVVTPQRPRPAVTADSSPTMTPSRVQTTGLRVVTDVSASADDLQPQYSPPDCIVGPRTVFPSRGQVALENQLPQTDVETMEKQSISETSISQVDVSSIPVASSQVFTVAESSNSSGIVPSAHLVQDTDIITTPLTTAQQPRVVTNVPEFTHMETVAETSMEIPMMENSQSMLAEANFSQNVPMDVQVTETVSSDSTVPIITSDSTIPMVTTTDSTTPMVTAADSSVPMVTTTDSTKDETAADPGGWDLFSGSGDLDLFSQALQQLSETNKKAKEFEQSQKQIEEPKPAVIPSTPSMSLVSMSQPLTPAPTPTHTSTLPSNPSLQRVLTMDNPSAMSPAPLERASSPLTVVHRVDPTGRPASPQVIVQATGTTLVRTQDVRGGVYTPPGTPTSILTPGSGMRRIVSVPQLQGMGGIATTPVGQTVRRVLPAGATRYTLPAGTPLAGAQKVTVASVSQLGSVVPTAASNGILPTVLTDKLVSQLWSNDEVKLKKIASNPVLPRYGNVLPEGSTVIRASPIEEEIEAEDDELGHAETYAEYMPPKLKVGLKHPDPVVETSSLSSVEPPNVFYKLSIPEHVIDLGALSALQLETIVYASQKHEILLPSGERAGFLVGDGAGVGKGRTIAGMIYENYLQGRKRALWLSVSNDLKVDAERDLGDVGASKIEVHPLNKFKYAKISSHINGSIKKGVIFATYSSLIGESHSGGKYRTRFKQLLHWLGKDFDGIIVFDECHRAKNLCPIGSSKPTKTGMTVLELQRKLPKARIVYASATGASEPRNMAYMTRLGLWGKGTPFNEFMDFIQAIEKRGVGAMELVAMDMKLRGMYIARQLSFHGVSFKIQEISIPKDFFDIYNASVKLWVDAREKFQRAADLISAEQRMRKTMWGQFWSSHQRFFKYLCISAKVPYCVKLARDAIKNGKCVVIGLQSTGEARTLEQLEESGGELNDFVSTAKGVLQSLVEKHFPAPDRKKTMDLFGWSSSIFNTSSQTSQKANLASKRKKTQNGKMNTKRTKVSWSDDESIPDSDHSEAEKSPEKVSEAESSGLSLSESSDDSDMDSDADNFNPFGSGSDSDDDPWLKKASKKKNKEKKKKKKMPKEKKKIKEKENLDKQKKQKPKKSKESDSDDDDFDDIDSRLDKVLMAAGLKNTEKTLASGDGLSRSVSPPKDVVEMAIEMKQELLRQIERLGERLPPNTLDDLIDQLGGPENVAEMTGRKGRVVCTDEGYVQYESRSEADTPLELMNLAEKQRFMDGEKHIAIISEAASSGISLQADRRVANQRRRVHITLELPWSADRAIQQFGRTHRSNQVSAPEYVFLISQLAGERRFASTVAKRLESLGALTHGDRRATESRDLSRFNIDNKYGRAALESVMKSVLQQEVPLVPPPDNYPGHFFQDVKRGLVGVGMIAVDERTGYSVLEKEYNNISKFLNRILGMEVDVQNHLFKYFTDTLAAVILQAKRNGRWDMGIQDLGTSGEDVTTVNSKDFKGNFSGSNTTVTLYTVSVERGLTWTKALDIWRDYEGEHDGFYLSNQTHSGKKPAILVIGMVGRKRERLYQVYRPNTGIQGRMETLDDIKKKYKKVFPNDARMWWEDQFDSSATICTHAYLRGGCRRAASGMMCEVGLRCRLYHVLSGSVLSIWTKVESVIASAPGGLISRMQIIRLRTSDGKKIVGTLIPSQALKQLEQMLSQSAAQSPQKQVAYTPFQHKPSPATAFSSLPAYLDSPLSSPRVSTTPPPPATPKQYLSMPAFL